MAAADDTPMSKISAYTRAFNEAEKITTTITTTTMGRRRDHDGLLEHECPRNCQQTQPL